MKSKLLVILGVIALVSAALFVIAERTTSTKAETNEVIGNSGKVVDGGCELSKPKGTCTVPSTWCHTTLIGDCQYYCVGADGATGSWSSGVKCAKGRSCNQQGLAGKCKKSSDI